MEPVATIDEVESVEGDREQSRATEQVDLLTPQRPLRANTPESRKPENTEDHTESEDDAVLAARYDLLCFGTVFHC